jgi:hypothetical protein
LRLYRVFPYDSGARPHEPGGALFRARGGYGRIDNPERYRTLYASSHPEGAVAEALGRFPEWTADVLWGTAGPRALAAYDLEDRESGAPRYYDLDDAANLLSQGLRPSRVVTRDRQTTQAWALRIFEQGSDDGVAWWSYYVPEWRSVGLWEIERLRPAAPPEPLSLTHPSLRLAATAIARIVRR